MAGAAHCLLWRRRGSPVGLWGGTAPRPTAFQQPPPGRWSCRRRISRLCLPEAGPARGWVCERRLHTLASNSSPQRLSLRCPWYHPGMRSATPLSRSAASPSQLPGHSRVEWYQHLFELVEPVVLSAEEQYGLSAICLLCLYTQQAASRDSCWDDYMFTFSAVCGLPRH